MVVKVSIVVPVYNASAFLTACISSLQAQTLQEIEIIIVDDGSSDDSAIIINRLAKADTRIIAVHGANEGVSSARNKGIAIARGEYLGFVDADDVVEPNMFAALYQALQLKNADIAICDVNTISENTITPNRLNLTEQEFNIANHRSLETEKLMLFKYDYANWNKLYSLDIVKKHQLRFDTAMKVYEDLLFNLCFFQYANRGVTIAGCYYHYRQHANSVMRDGQIHRLSQYQLLWEKFSGFCRQFQFVDSLYLFEQQMRRGMYFAVIPAVTFALNSSRVSFFHRVRFLTAQLRMADPGFFEYTPEELAGITNWKKKLLQWKQYQLFSMLKMSAALLRSL